MKYIALQNKDGSIISIKYKPSDDYILELLDSYDKVRINILEGDIATISKPNPDLKLFIIGRTGILEPDSDYKTHSNIFEFLNSVPDFETVFLFCEGLDYFKCFTIKGN